MTEGPSIYPAFRYRDARAAIDWLVDVLDFREEAAYEGDDGTIHHAELSHGPGLIMLGTERDDRLAGRVGHSLVYLAVEDPDGLYERARSKGAEIVDEIHDTDYGSRDFSVRDPEGNVWSLGTYRPRPGGDGD